jgi:hypothetical protein
MLILQATCLFRPSRPHAHSPVHMLIQTLQATCLISGHMLMQTLLVRGNAEWSCQHCRCRAGTRNRIFRYLWGRNSLSPVCGLLCECGRGVPPTAASLHGDEVSVLNWSAIAAGEVAGNRVCASLRLSLSYFLSFFLVFPFPNACFSQKNGS